MSSEKEENLILKELLTPLNQDDYLKINYLSNVREKQLPNDINLNLFIEEYAKNKIFPRLRLNHYKAINLLISDRISYLPDLSYMEKMRGLRLNYTEPLKNILPKFLPPKLNYNNLEYLILENMKFYEEFNIDYLLTLPKIKYLSLKNVSNIELPTNFKGLTQLSLFGLKYPIDLSLFKNTNLVSLKTDCPFLLITEDFFKDCNIKTIMAKKIVILKNNNPDYYELIENMHFIGELKYLDITQSKEIETYKKIINAGLGFPLKEDGSNE